MPQTLNTRVSGPGGDVIVITKVRFYFVFHLPRTSVMPFSGKELAKLGVQFHWNTDRDEELQRLHLLITNVMEQLTLPELRTFADAGKQFLAIGAPCCPPDAPFPQALKEISRWVKRVM